MYVCKWYDALRCAYILTCLEQEGRHVYRDGEIMIRLGWRLRWEGSPRFDGEIMLSSCRAKERRENVILADFRRDFSRSVVCMFGRVLLLRCRCDDRLTLALSICCDGYRMQLDKYVPWFDGLDVIAVGYDVDPSRLLCEHEHIL